jgi:hypothetical protein
MTRTTLSFLCLIIVLTGCDVLKKSSKEDFEEGVYTMPAKQPFRNIVGDSSSSFNKKTTVFLFEESDTLWFISKAANGAPAKNTFLYPLQNDEAGLVLQKRSFDFDVFVTPFKYRFAIKGLPPQMNTSFNGSFYFGYRMDKYAVHKTKLKFGIEREKFKKTGLGVGVFAGVGSVFINPVTMQNTIDYEYDGFVLDYGVAVLAGIRNISTGLSVGFDFLPSNRGKNWIYQHKPWIGIFIGLNLN